MKFYQKEEFILEFIQLVQECNEIILNIYNRDFDVQYKEDSDGNKSPLTLADQLTNEHICQYLIGLNKKLELEVPTEKFLIISEEKKNDNYQYRKKFSYTWLVDPLDGTKEFVKKNGQFTVNIGLCYWGVPVFGIVSIPVTGEIYYGAQGLGSFKLNFKENWDHKLILKISEKKDLKSKGKGLKIVASSSHMNDDTKKFIQEFHDPELISVGSSIKLLYIAENKADIYPRLAPTSEWDTCAAHAIIKYAGGIVYNWETKNELVYNKPNLLNPYFIAE